MDETVAGWANFFVAEVGATAALTGLIIVAVSINLQRILAVAHLPSRAAEMLIMLVCALVACSFALMPGQTLPTLGVEIAGTGVLMTAAPMAIQARQFSYMKGKPVAWWLGRLIVALCASLPILIGGGYLLANASAGLYWVAAGVMVTLAATVSNAWVLLVEILR
jgi:hypothetical protein